MSGAVTLAVLAAYFSLRDDGASRGNPPPTSQSAPQQARSADAMPFFSAVAADPATPAGVSKAAEIARLSASGSPADAYRAFEMAAECNGIRLSRRYWPGSFDEAAERAHCGDITALQIRDMTSNLDKAVAADIPHALMRKFHYGPAGDFFAVHQRPDDPYVIAWKQAMMLELTGYLQRTGESLTMLEYANLLHFGTFGVKDDQLAYGYMVAREQLDLRSSDARVRRRARSSPAASHELAKELTEQQIAAATAFANHFIATCCKKR